jgi:zinc-finger of transposase IS204/IS1001/IS1096/IS1165
VPTESEFTRILQWPGYRVYRLEIDERNKAIDLWVRRKRGNRKLECSGCGRKYTDAYDSRERAVRDLPWSAFQATVHIEIYRVKCEECGVRIEKVPLLPSKALFDTSPAPQHFFAFDILWLDGNSEVYRWWSGNTSCAPSSPIRPRRCSTSNTSINEVLICSERHNYGMQLLAGDGVHESSYRTARLVNAASRLLDR